MKIMEGFMKKLFAILLAVLCVSAFSQRKIESALGQTLGESVVGGLKVTQSGSLVNISYEPKEKFRGFSNYNVMVTPKTRKVYWISCFRIFNSGTEALDEQANVLKIFGGTYTGRFEKVSDSLGKNNYILSRKDQSIIVEVNEIGSKYKVKIFFIDFKLREQAEKEWQNMEVLQIGSADGSQRKIESAFGQTLGARVSDSMQTENVGHFIGCFFDPEKKFRGFNEYFLEITPQTRKICFIACTQTFDSKKSYSMKWRSLRKFMKIHINMNSKS